MIECDELFQGTLTQCSVYPREVVRCALAWSTETATLGRQHNDANVVSIGARMHALDVAVGFVETFLATDYSGDARHSRRIDMITAYEGTGELPER